MANLVCFVFQRVATADQVSGPLLNFAVYNAASMGVKLTFTYLRNTRAHTGTSCLVNYWKSPLPLNYRKLLSEAAWESFNWLSVAQRATVKVLLLFGVFFLLKLEDRSLTLSGGGIQEVYSRQINSRTVAWHPAEQEYPFIIQREWMKWCRQGCCGKDRGSASVPEPQTPTNQGETTFSSQLVALWRNACLLITFSYPPH